MGFPNIELSSGRLFPNTFQTNSARYLVVYGLEDEGTIITAPLKAGQITALNTNRANEDLSARTLISGSRRTAVLSGPADGSSIPPSSAIELELNFDGPVSGLEAEDFTVTNGFVTSLIEITPSRYFIRLRASSLGPTVSVQLGGNMVDAPGNVASNLLIYTIAATGPFIDSATVTGELSQAPRTTTARIRFSEPIVSFDVSGISPADGVRATGATQIDGSTWSLILESDRTSGASFFNLTIPPGSYETAGGAANVTSSSVIGLFDFDSPNIVAVPEGGDISATDPTPITVGFDKPMSLAIDASLLQTYLNSITATGATISNGRVGASGSAPRLFFDITPMAGGTVQVTLPSGTLTDRVGNPLQGRTLTYQTGAPVSISLTEAPTEVVSFGQQTVLVTLSDPVTTLDVSDFDLTNAAARGLTQLTPTTYRFAFVAVAERFATISVPADSIEGFGNLASNVVSVEVDLTGPSVVSSSFSSQIGLIPQPASITFSEPAFFVVNIIDPRFATNLTLSNLQTTDQITYTFDITGTGTPGVAFFEYPLREVFDALANRGTETFRSPAMTEPRLRLP